MEMAGDGSLSVDRSGFSLPPETDGLMTGVQHGLVGLNQILGNKNHDTENKAIQFNPAGIAAAAIQSN